MPKNKKSVSPAQTKGSCGHTKGAWDSHKSCIACTRCSRENPCETCSYWPTESWDKANKRRTYASRNKNKSTRPVTEGEKHNSMEKVVSQELSDCRSPNPAKLSVAFDGKQFQKAAALESPDSSVVSITAGTVGRGASLSKHEDQPQERTVSSLPGHKDAVQHNLSPLGSTRSCFSQQTEPDKIRFRVISDNAQLSDMHPMSDRDQRSDRFQMQDIDQMSDRNQLSTRYLLSTRHSESDRHQISDGEFLARPITIDQASTSRKSSSAPSAPVNNKTPIRNRSLDIENRYRSEAGSITGHRSPPRHRSPVKYRSPEYHRSIIDHRSTSGHRS